MWLRWVCKFLLLLTDATRLEEAKTTSAALGDLVAGV
jgi:hypothetical protein